MRVTASAGCVLARGQIVSGDVTLAKGVTIPLQII